MAGISVSNICVPFGGGGFSWSSYWATLISATVEGAAPTHVVLTFPAAQTSLTDTDFTIAGFTISSASWTGAVLTLVLSEAVLVYDGDLTITFGKTSESATLTNNVADDGNTVAWYDSSDLTTIDKDVNDLVAEWEDKLGSGHDLLQATPTNKPKWEAEGVLFDGNDNWMQAEFAFTQPESIYIIFKQITWTLYSAIFDGATNDGQLGQRPNPSPNLALNAGISSDKLALDTFAVVRVVINGANSKIQINEEAAVTGNAGATHMGGFTLGSYKSHDAYFSNCQVYEAILRSGVDDAATDALIYNYLKKKVI